MADTADKIIDATMALLADRPYEEVTVRAIAEAAGVSLGELNRHFPTRGHILKGFARQIDGAVLENTFSDMADEAARDRLFDVLMSRLDALAPHKAALKSLMRAARRDPGVALGLNAIALRSQSWMLAAAGLSATGWRGRVAVQSLAVAFAKVLRTFVDEDDPGMPRTMAKLDRELRELESRHKRLARVFGDALRGDQAAEASATSAAIDPDSAEATGGAPDGGDTLSAGAYNDDLAPNDDTLGAAPTGDDDTVSAVPPATPPAGSSSADPRATDDDGDTNADTLPGG
ncbi:MAG: helix-turn-helix domain-containing protein [Pseudomonadota bacterium]